MKVVTPSMRRIKASLGHMQDALQRRQSQGGDEEAHRPVADLMQRFLIGQGTELVAPQSDGDQKGRNADERECSRFQERKATAAVGPGAQKGAKWHDSIYTRLRGPAFQPYFTISRDFDSPSMSRFPARGKDERSFMPQRVDRVEPCGAPGREESKAQADGA